MSAWVGVAMERRSSERHEGARFVDGFKSEKQNVKIDAVAGQGASGLVEEQGCRDGWTGVPQTIAAAELGRS